MQGDERRLERLEDEWLEVDDYELTDEEVNNFFEDADMEQRERLW